MNLNEERVHKVSRKAKKSTIPSFTDQEFGKSDDDNLRKIKTSELKQLKGIDTIALPNTGIFIFLE